MNRNLKGYKKDEWKKMIGIGDYEIGRLGNGYNKNIVNKGIYERCVE